MSLPASVLAAFLERPFVTSAGVAHNALWHSLRANLISLGIGYVTMPIALIAIYSIAPLWSVIAVSLSILFEGIYYQKWVLRGAERLRWRWVVVGNIWSSLILLSLPFITTALKQARPDLVWELAPYQDALLAGSVAGSILLFVAAWVVPNIRRGKKTESSPTLVSPDEREQRQNVECLP
jgi:hypothetical protein